MGGRFFGVRAYTPPQILGRYIKWIISPQKKYQFDEGMADGTYLLQTVMENVGLDPWEFEDENIPFVTAMGIVEAPEGRMYQQEVMGRSLDPKKTWVEKKDGKVRRSTKPPTHSPAQRQDDFKQMLTELAKAPGGRQALDSFFSGTMLSAAYNPHAKPLEGIPYEPYYTAFVRGDIMGHIVDYLVDIGATILVLTVETVIRLNLQDVVQPTNKCFTSASSHSVHSQGELPQLLIHIGGVLCHVSFYIAPKGGYELLGMDVLMPRRVALDFNDSTMRMAKRLPEVSDDYL